ncbi:DUF1415 domain-containing protein [Noviherbaspirillum saxi]|uniref:DUF1415 domain-containing protein n=1 Tax=Noviherbaspirillum saxi TaxID=2320863 RepID=A0A3A3FPJ7_9BURK|nr:DUF1415 domain-containing protein [Noviherbaspirillum saxi]RJF97936.1 DUF1415 domain-containing protein [Noviherbaspirillum saxi]
MTILDPDKDTPSQFTPPVREIIAATTRWLEKAVIGLNLCPFAKAVHVKQQIRFAVSDARDTDQLMQDLISELQRLQAGASDVIDTTVLVHPWVLNEFLDYNAFLSIADAVLEELGLTGEIQIASFHPAYQFADSEPDAIDNFTNRSPYPILHLLREDSIDRAVAAFPDASDIFEHNIETMKRLGKDGWAALNVGPEPKHDQSL